MIYIFLFLFGITIGSFLNVLIYRIPNNITMSGRSKCPKCKTEIKWYHNIPLFSWLYLKGKCSKCDFRIPKSIFIVELISGLLTLLIAYKENYILGTYFYLEMIIIYNFIVLAVIDIKYKAVPDIISIPTLLLSIWLLSINSGNYMESFKIVATIIGSIYIIKYIIELILNKEILGEADIIIAGIMLSLLNGNYKLLFVSIYASAILVLFVYIINKYIRKKEEIFIPFIPYLLAGVLISMFFGNDYLNLIN